MAMMTTETMITETMTTDVEITTMPVAVVVVTMMMGVRIERQMITQPTLLPSMKKTYQMITAVGGVEEDRETIVHKQMGPTQTRLLKDLDFRMELWLLVELLSQPLQLFFLKR